MKANCLVYFANRSLSRELNHEPGFNSEKKMNLNYYNQWIFVQIGGKWADTLELNTSIDVWKDIKDQMGKEWAKRIKPS